MIPAPDALPDDPHAQPADRPERDCPDADCEERFGRVGEAIAHTHDAHGFEAFSHLTK